MRIGGLQKFSLIDYPGELAAVIFTQGCNFRCPYCHNKDLVLPECFREPLKEDEVFLFLEKRQGFLDAVVVTGGEPTIHKDLPALLERIRGLGYLIKLDTNGSNPQMLKKIINLRLVDYIAMDLKAPLEKYHLLAGVKVDLESIKKSMSLIIHSYLDYEFRTTVVKSMISPADFQKMADLTKRAQKYRLQRFIPRDSVLDKSLLDDDYFTDEEISQLQEKWGKDSAGNVNSFRELRSLKR
jgi:pyruvate formate lyase activating enzyme